ncbi:MAG: arginase family protein [Spirochaetes bacterium]|nr:arginase family protein [Spirochaetota bacterium]
MKVASKLNLFFPQWQCSGYTKELFFGTKALKEYIGSEVEVTDIEIILNENTEIKNDILGFDVILQQMQKVNQVFMEKHPEKIFTIGGGCGVEVSILSYLKKTYKNLAVYWLDAHGDLNTPASSPSKHFHGMPLRFLLESIPDNEIAFYTNRLSIDEVVLVGVRDLDPPEADFIANNQIPILRDKKSISVELVNQFRRLKNKTFAYIHIDLDVLDPQEYKNVKCPALNGLSIAEVKLLIDKIKQNHQIVGVSLLENTETSLNEIKKIDDIIQAGLTI